MRIESSVLSMWWIPRDIMRGGSPPGEHDT
jgi:hypothetical protein